MNAIYVIFKETQFMTLMRSERYGFIDFISNCGGLMGKVDVDCTLQSKSYIHFVLFQDFSWAFQFCRLSRFSIMELRLHTILFSDGVVAIIEFLILHNNFWIFSSKHKIVEVFNLGVSFYCFFHISISNFNKKF